MFLDVKSVFLKDASKKDPDGDDECFYWLETKPPRSDLYSNPPLGGHRLYVVWARQAIHHGGETTYLCSVFWALTFLI